MQVILYARFSPRRNAEDCESIEHQLADMRDWCQQRNHEIIGEYTDEVLSGGDYNRPGLWDAIAACQPGQAVAVRQLDRLARDVYLCEVIVRSIRGRRGTLIVTHGGGTLEDNPDADMLRQILQAVAERQRKVTSALTKAAMLRKQADGIRMSKQLPYGWKLDVQGPKNAAGVPTRMMRNPRQQKIIEALVVEYAVSHRLANLGALRRGRGFRELARLLEQQAVPAPGGGRHWRGQSVKQILIKAGITPQIIM